MSHYDFTRTFRELYDKALGLYAKGQREAKSYFNPSETAWLASNGITPQHLYDYAEDQTNYGEPGYDNALGIELIRRDYFLNAQGGKPSSTVLDQSKMPSKSETVGGIAWLPRILPKAKAKLRGELPASLMYSCGGDREFFKNNNIQSTEFLNLVWRNLNNDAAIVDWTVKRSTAKS